MNILKIIKKIIRRVLNFQLIANLQSFSWRLRLRKKGKNLRVFKNIKVMNPQFLTIGDDVKILNDVSFTISRSCQNGGGVFIGSGTHINKWCDFGCDNKIIIGEDCLFGPFVHITDRNHNFEDINEPIIKQGSSSKGPVIIGSGCWFGFRSQVMSNVKIGRNCVIAAGAVVTKDVPDYCVVAGNPAKIIKIYNPGTKTWNKP